MTMLSPRHQRSLQGRDHPSARAMGHWKPSSFATLEWVDWFNNRRLSEPIGNIPPAEAEERYYAMLEQRNNLPWRRDFKPNGLRQTRSGSVWSIPMVQLRFRAKAERPG